MIGAGFVMPTNIHDASTLMTDMPAHKSTALLDLFARLRQNGAINEPPVKKGRIIDDPKVKNGIEQLNDKTITGIERLRIKQDMDSYVLATYQCYEIIKGETTEFVDRGTTAFIEYENAIRDTDFIKNIDKYITLSA